MCVTSPQQQLAPPTPKQQLDSRVQIVTPENIAFEYRVAGPFTRVGAYLIDLGIQAAVVAATFVLFVIFAVIVFSSSFGGSGYSLGEVIANLGAFTIFVLWFLMQWFYGSWFEARWNGQTPGKKMLGLRTLCENGQPIDVQQAVLRNLIRLLDALPMLPLPQFFLMLMPLLCGSHLAGLVSMAMTKRHQRLGDLACGTIVVCEEQTISGRIEVADDPAVRQVMELVPANYQPSPTLGRALSHYQSRRRYFGPARRKEIAKHVGGVLVEQLNLPPETDHDLLLCALSCRSLLSHEALNQEAAIRPTTPIENKPKDETDIEEPVLEVSPFA